MKEYKLERAYKVATMARNRLRKLMKLFQCADSGGSHVESVYNQQLVYKLGAGMSAAARAIFLIDKLYTWEAAKSQPDEELLDAMEEAMWLACTHDSKSQCTCLPNHWLFVARKDESGDVEASLADCVDEWLNIETSITGREVVKLGIVRQRGTHSPRSLARKALAYAKAHPEEVKDEK